MPVIPAGPDEITPDWLNQVLGDEIGEITEVTRHDMATGIGILAVVTRLGLTYRDGPGAGPATLVTKTSSPTPENVFLCQAMGFYAREVAFYTELADQLHGVIRTPRCHHAAVDESGAQMVVVLDEVTDARCPDQIAGLSLSDAEQIIDTIAALHARFWGSPELDQMGWLPPMNNPMYKGAQPMAQQRWDDFVAHFGDQIDPDTLDATRRLVFGPYSEYLDWQAETSVTTVTHTDCRAENYLFGADGEPTVLDWQLCTRHVGPWDVANLLGASLQPELRRTHTEALITRYHQALVDGGVSDYPLERCWDDLRACLLHQCVAQVVTSDLGGGDERGAELLFHLHLRPFLMAADIGVADLPAVVGA